MKLLIGALTGCIFVLGCAQHSKKTVGEAAEYRESSYYDGNVPPEAMQPKLWKKGDDLSKNKLFVQTQADYHFTVAEAYSNEGDPKKAVESFRTALLYDPDSAVIRVRLATEYIKIGILTEAMEHAEKATKVDPENVEAQLLLAGLYSSMRMYDSAIDGYKKVLQMQPDNTEAPLFIGAVYAEKKEYDEAIGYFTQLTKNKEYKSKHLAYYYIGRLYVEEANPLNIAKAETAFKKSLEEKPSFDDAITGLASFYRNQDQGEKGIKILRDWQNKYGPNAQVAEILSQYFLENEQYEEAQRQLLIVESFSPRDLNVKVKIALVLIEREKYDRAVTKLEQIIAQVPDSDKIRFYLAAVYEELNNFPLAIENYAKIPPLSHYYSEAVVHKAYLHKVAGSHAKARATLEEGLKHRRDVPQFYTLYASILDEMNDHHVAVEILSEGVERFPSHVQIRFFLGSMYDKTGDLSGTLREMRKVTEMDEKHVQALNYLAYTMAENRMDLQEAEKLARRALALEPEDGYILDTLGWILYRQGRVEESITVLELAHSKQKTESVIAEHLGDAYHSQQLPEKAKSMYAIAIRSTDDKTKAKKIQEKIAAIEQQLNLRNRTPASEK